ncbi:MAG: hypothetical protein IPP15_13465 [Saprospiraceae bacterium]|uniref:Uncharacterized protein n=1 Tax=Candidatus Opimibacter skivensis TaxID=2982028 RepID=A0A9D7SXA9_9BACT|nr:hypothetical protein [Candidatus Opimibacter skivensis]
MTHSRVTQRTFTIAFYRTVLEPLDSLLVAEAIAKETFSRRILGEGDMALPVQSRM